MTLVDTNVIVDVLKADPVWMPWSSQQLMQARRAGPLGINFVVHAELAVHAEVAHEMDGLLDDLGVVVHESSRASARLAAAAFRQYRQRGGIRTGVLPDFFHWRPGADRRLHAAHARRSALPQLLPHTGTDLPLTAPSKETTPWEHSPSRPRSRMCPASI